MKAFRSIDVIHAMREDGTTIGRPMGAKKKPEKIILYGKTDQLIRLYNEGQTPANIAAQLGVSRGTIVNYIRANGLTRKK